MNIVIPFHHFLKIDKSPFQVFNKDLYGMDTSDKANKEGSKVYHHTSRKVSCGYNMPTLLQFKAF